jgi:hypothetical protein
MSERKPLWWLMRNAYDMSSIPDNAIEASDPDGADCLSDRYGYAAELEAVAHEVDSQFAKCFPDTSGQIVTDTIVNWLFAEAKRAKEGQ